jgi:hypothetical protein
MTEGKTYVLKDDKGNYVGVNSISYDEPTRENIYSWSERLVNGFYTYTEKSDVMKDLKLLQEKGLKINFGKNFHIEKINISEVLKNENKVGNSLAYPFKYEIIGSKSVEELATYEESICSVGS